MANEETSRFRWPFPAWDADWQRWQDTFSDLVSNIDSTVFSAVDGARLIFKSIPNAEIVSNGPGYDLVMSGSLVMQSRAHGVEVAIPAGTYSLTALAVAAISTTPGAIGTQLISWEMLEGGLEATPNVIPLGYVDSSYNITWWNGSRLLAGGGDSQLFGGASGSDGAVALASSATDGGLSLTVQEIGFRAATESVSGYLTSADWATFNSKAMWADATVEDVSVASGGTAVGSFDISCNQGLVTELLAYVQTGSTDDVDVELGDSSFSGSPDILYQIGQDDELAGLWDPDTNGNWKDRNAWGFKGLTAGLLYYRFTNNGANAITMGLAVDVIGKA